MKIHRFLPLALLVLALAFAGFTFASPAVESAIEEAPTTVATAASAEAPAEDGDTESESAFPWPETFTDLPSVGPGQECLANCVIALQGCLRRCVQPNGSLNPSCVSQCQLDFDECSGECNS